MLSMEEHLLHSDNRSFHLNDFIIYYLNCLYVYATLHWKTIEFWWSGKFNVVPVTPVRQFCLNV